VALASLGHVGGRYGLHHEGGPGGDEALGVGCIVDGANAEYQFRAVVIYQLSQLLKHLKGIGPAVGKLKYANTTRVAGPHHGLCVSCIGVEKNRHQRRCEYLGENFGRRHDFQLAMGNDYVSTAR
jgi:hypothetical protein